MENGIPNPLTHKQRQEAPFALLAYDFLEAGIYGAIVGTLGARIFKAYSPRAGAAMGVAARVASVIPNRMWSNLNSIGDLQANQGLGNDCAYACYAKQAVWLAPLGAWAFGFQVNSKMVARYWLTTAALTLILYPIKHYVIYKILDIAGIGRMTIERGFQEWCTRPAEPTGFVRLSDAHVHLAPVSPVLIEPARLAGTPSLAHMATGVIPTEQVAIIQRAEPRDPGPRGTVVRQEFFKLSRNLASFVHSISDPEEKRTILTEVALAFDHCTTRQITACYDLLADLNAGAGTQEEKLKRKILLEVHELKRHILLDFAKTQGMSAVDSTHLWSACTEGCGNELGLIRGELIPEQAMLELDGDHAGAAWVNDLARGVLSPSRTFFLGANKWFWVRGVKARYRACDPQLLIDRVRNRLNLESSDGNAAMRILAQHLEAQGAKNSNGTDADELDLIEHDGALTQHYCTPNKSGVGYDLNDEGIILLLKLTGDLVDDGRLHTQLTNDEVLNQCL